MIYQIQTVADKAILKPWYKDLTNREVIVIDLATHMSPLEVYVKYYECLQCGEDQFYTLTDSDEAPCPKCLSRSKELQAKVSLVIQGAQVIYREYS